jgi:hypothetical protein
MISRLPSAHRSWDAKTTAVMNGIDEDAPLRTGQRIKVAAAEPFAGTD